MSFLGFTLHFAYPACLWLLLFIPLYLGFLQWLAQRRRGILYPNLNVIREISPLPGQWWRHSVLVCRVLALAALIIVLSRPQHPCLLADQPQTGLEIILILDLSESMLADDLHPSRLAGAKKVLKKFIAKRPFDRMGLVVFSGISITQIPLTTDHQTLVDTLAELNTRTVPVEGTAIGEALLTGMNRLLDSFSPLPDKNRPGKIIILATDGVNNRGVDPWQAAQIAQTKQIKIYSIGLGSQQAVIRFTTDWQGRRVPLTDFYGRVQYWEKPDEALLRHLAQLTQGKYFRAQDSAEFQKVMDEIDRLEKRQFKQPRLFYYQELAFWPLGLALFLLILERVLSTTRFRKLLWER